MRSTCPEKLVEPLTAAQIESACAQACGSIAPSWPLDRSIAVNPHWGRIGMPVRKVAARMLVLGGVAVFPSRASQRAAWAAGRIRADDLASAVASLPAAQQLAQPVAQCLAALDTKAPIAQLPLLIDVLDNDAQRQHRLSWRQAITHQVSQTCAAYFDRHQADWQPERGNGLYAFWRDTLLHDHGIGALMGLPKLGSALAALPATHEQAERWVLQRLALPATALPDYLEAVLLTVNGWASHCAYLGWQARLEGRSDGHLRELLAIRLAWGAILLACKGDRAATPAFAALQAAWAGASVHLQQAESALLADEIWQGALEAGYQRQLAAKLAASEAKAPAAGPMMLQAAFCIDVRSEPMRRALEAAAPGIETIGCAGFFGLPIAHTPLGTASRRPQLPGLLAPAIESSDAIVQASAQGGARDAAGTQAAVQARRDRLALAAQWNAATRWPGAAFSFVEAAGVAYLAQLGRWLRPGRQVRPRDDLAGLPTRYRQLCRPQMTGLDLDSQVALAAGVLRGMGLTGQLAPLVLLVGHGSQSHNNAHAASLDCGACCGQTGEVNARSLAHLLNDPQVRAGLAARRLMVPPACRFIAALHNTTTDEIEAFDLDLLPPPAAASWQTVEPLLASAGAEVRRERAPQLGLDPLAAPPALLDSLRRRASDGAQTRPEWGLAGNAAFIIAPRARTRHLDLNGRSFLHDYDAGADPDGSLLEQLMTAPMLVTHWINWQYHSSLCDPLRLGSGNKLLHNVVGGNLGIFEGNGGDLRIGLSRQSLHDGARAMHEPLRLTVVIDAPAAAIERVLHKHEVVRQLVHHGWLHLWRLDNGKVMRYACGQWQSLAAPEPAPYLNSEPTY